MSQFAVAGPAPGYHRGITWGWSAMSAPLLFTLCLASGAFYAAAGAVLKLAGGAPFALLLLPVFVVLALAAWFESRALAGSRFALVVLLILAAEVVISIAIAAALGERYGLRELAGLLLIVAGVALIYAGPGAAHPL